MGSRSVLDFTAPLVLRGEGCSSYIPPFEVRARIDLLMSAHDVGAERCAGRGEVSKDAFLFRRFSALSFACARWLLRARVHSRAMGFCSRVTNPVYDIGVVL